MDLRGKHGEIGVDAPWHKKYNENAFENSFDSMEKFIGAYDTDDFGLWTVTIMYQNTEITFSGEKESTEIGVSYPKGRKLSLLPLLRSVETETYCYNHYDKKILAILKDDYKMNYKRAVLALEKLQTHLDIYEEFVLAATAKKHVCKDKAVMVEGFTAEKLNTEFPLSMIGAYNFLIYLREHPKEALMDLEKGLPRK